MKNTAIIIPTRLGAKRFPNKPLAKINNIPMIIHTLNRGLESGVGEVFVATPDNEILEIVKKHGGHAIITGNHPNGTSRVFEAFKKIKKENVDLIINLQADLPQIKGSSISKLEKLMRENNSPIGTLASLLTKDETNDENVVKVEVETDLKKDNFSKAKDFFRIKKDLKNEKIYHHIGIYAFTKDALTQYVKLPISKLEVKRNLEQMRAMENNFTVKVGLCASTPLGVDTEEDLLKVTREMSEI
jgi:3-deoxy-manno-octulosonate cytidylyltransferase (CMP-KDO synthetase)